MSDSFDRLLARTERRNRTGDGPCPDADVLAAYLDATLSGAERVSVEAHAADCARCALVLATVVRLEDESGDPRHAVAPRSWPSVAWLVPAAAAVLVAGIYVATPRHVLRSAPSPAESNAPAASTEPLASAQAQAQAPAPAPAPAVPPVRQEASNDMRMRELSPLRRSPSLAAKAAPAPAPRLPVNRLDDLERRDKLTTDHRAVTVAERPSAPATLESDAKPESRVPASAVVVGAAAGPSFIIRSPDARVLWRVSANGIERSRDGGGSWAREHGPVSGRVRGASPSAAVCWLATSEGQVLRRNVDGTWADVSPAVSLTIDRLESKSALEATVAGPDGTRETTVDGGRTWKRESR